MIVQAIDERHTSLREVDVASFSTTFAALLPLFKVAGERVIGVPSPGAPFPF